MERQEAQLRQEQRELQQLQLQKLQQRQQRCPRARGGGQRGLALGEAKPSGPLSHHPWQSQRTNRHHVLRCSSDNAMAHPLMATQTVKLTVTQKVKARAATLMKTMTTHQPQLTQKPELGVSTFPGGAEQQRKTEIAQGRSPKERAKKETQQARRPSSNIEGDAHTNGKGSQKCSKKAKRQGQEATCLSLNPADPQLRHAASILCGNDVEIEWMVACRGAASKQNASQGRHQTGPRMN